MIAWKSWEGGECPVDKDVLVEVKLFGGEVVQGVAAMFRWERISSLGDIVSYRTIENEMTDTKENRATLDLAISCGAQVTGTPDGREPVQVVFNVKAWRLFSARIAANKDREKRNGY